MVLAEMSTEVQMVIAVGVIAALKQIVDTLSLYVKDRIDQRRAAEVKQAALMTASKVEKKLDENKQANVDHLTRQDAAIAEVKKVADGQTDKLVEAVREAATSAGIIQGRKDEATEFPAGRKQLPS